MAPFLFECLMTLQSMAGPVRSWLMVYPHGLDTKTESGSPKGEGKPREEKLHNSLYLQVKGNTEYCCLAAAVSAHHSEQFPEENHCRGLLLFIFVFCFSYSSSLLSFLKTLEALSTFPM